MANIVNHAKKGNSSRNHSREAIVVVQEQDIAILIIQEKVMIVIIIQEKDIQHKLFKKRIATLIIQGMHPFSYFCTFLV